MLGIFICAIILGTLILARYSVGAAQRRAERGRALAANARHHISQAGRTLPAPLAPGMDLALIDERIADLERGKRYAELVGALEERAEMVADAQKIETLTRLLQIYRDRFSNEALAVQTAEAMVAYDPSVTAAVDYLREAYKKRRDPEALEALERRLASQAASYRKPG